MKKSLLPSIFFICLFGAMRMHGQGHEIKVSIKNSRDSICILTRYTWESPMIVDTARVDKSGNMVFKGKAPLEKGIYSIYSPKRSALYFDFIIDQVQKLTIATDTADFYGKMKITGSPENEEFLEFVKFMGAKNKERFDFEKQVRASKPADSTKLFTEKGAELYKAIHAYQRDYLSKHPTTYIATIIRLQMDNDVPNAPKDIAAKDTALWKYQYYKNHYWDGINLNDIGTLNTNKIFADKLKNYFTKVLLQDPDTLAKESDKVVLLIGNNKETFKWVVHNLLVISENSKVVGMDKFFVYLGRKYFLTNRDYWLEKKDHDKIVKRVGILEPLLIGNVAPELRLADTTAIAPLKKMGIDTASTSEILTNAYYKNQAAIDKMLINFQNIKADYTVLVFWDVDCGHCKKEIPVLLDVYHKMKKEGINLEVCAIYTQHEYGKWKNYIRENKLDWVNLTDAVHFYNLHEKYDIFSTPVIYVLDKNKIIRYKRIGADQVEDVIGNMEKKSKG